MRYTQLCAGKTLIHILTTHLQKEEKEEEGEEEEEKEEEKEIIKGVGLKRNHCCGAWEGAQWMKHRPADLSSDPQTPHKVKAPTCNPSSYSETGS